MAIGIVSMHSHRFASLVVSLYLLPLLGLTAGEKQAPLPPIQVTNYAPGEESRIPVPLLRGELADRNASAVTVVNTSSQRPTREMTGLVREGRFKVLCELVPGENKLVLKAGDAEVPFT